MVTENYPFETGFFYTESGTWNKELMIEKREMRSGNRLNKLDMSERYKTIRPGDKPDEKTDFAGYLYCLYNKAYIKMLVCRFQKHRY